MNLPVVTDPPRRDGLFRRAWRDLIVPPAAPEPFDYESTSLFPRPTSQYEAAKAASTTSAAPFRGSHVCARCGYMGDPMKIVRGEALTELLLYFLALIPGVLYSTWRTHGPKAGCILCGHNTMIPADSPFGRQLALKAIGADAPPNG